MSADARLRVLVVDDDVRFLGLLCSLLDDDGFAVVGRAADAATAEALAGEHLADVAVIDYVLPGADGIAVGDTLRGLQPGLPVVLFSSLFDKTVWHAASARGFYYVEKADGLDALEAAIREAARQRLDPPAAPSHAN